MLIRWGCEIAQEHGVPASLGASPVGFPLYKKFGFQEVERFVFDLGKYGGVGSRVNMQMIRYPENISDVIADMNIQHDEEQYG